nr:type II toxin-antitoxin system RelE/ParE family toxin [Proteus mirabilis]
MREDGPNLGRPQVDTLKGSKYPNMKELRIQVGGHPIRACLHLISFAVVLCYVLVIKRKDETRFYKKLIKIADAEYTAPLLEQEK